LGETKLTSKYKIEENIKDDITRWDIWHFGRFERCSEDFPALSKVVGW